MTPAETRAEAVRWRVQCVRWARSYGLDAARAEDVAQEAAAELLRQGEAVQRESASAWLRTVVVRLSRRALPREVLLPEVPEQVADDSPEDTVRSAEIGAAVRKAIAAMPASRRAVVVEVLAEGRSVPDVAAQEGIPESTVRARLRDGTEDLRGVLVRERAAERRRSGGFSSWAVVWAVADFVGRARKVVRAGLPVAFGAVLAGGALLTFEGPRLAPTPDELPARVADVAPVRWSESSARAVPGVDREAPVVVPRERVRHDAGARFRAERFGQ